MPSALVLVGAEGMGEAVQGCTPARFFCYLLWQTTQAKSRRCRQSSTRRCSPPSVARGKAASSPPGAQGPADYAVPRGGTLCFPEHGAPQAPELRLQEHEVSNAAATAREAIPSARTCLAGEQRSPLAVRTTSGERCSPAKHVRVGGIPLNTYASGGSR